MPSTWEIAWGRGISPKPCFLIFEEYSRIFSQGYDIHKIFRVESGPCLFHGKILQASKQNWVTKGKTQEAFGALPLGLISPEDTSPLILQTAFKFRTSIRRLTQNAQVTTQIPLHRRIKLIKNHPGRLVPTRPTNSSNSTVMHQLQTDDS